MFPKRAATTFCQAATTFCQAAATHFQAAATRFGLQNLNFFLKQPVFVFCLFCCSFCARGHHSLVFTIHRVNLCPLWCFAWSLGALCWRWCPVGVLRSFLQHIDRVCSGRCSVLLASGMRRCRVRSLGVCLRFPCFRGFACVVVFSLVGAGRSHCSFWLWLVAPGGRLKVPLRFAFWLVPRGGGVQWPVAACRRWRLCFGARRPAGRLGARPGAQNSCFVVLVGGCAVRVWLGVLFRCLLLARVWGMYGQALGRVARRALGWVPRWAVGRVARRVCWRALGRVVCWALGRACGPPGPRVCDSPGLGMCGPLGLGAIVRAGEHQVNNLRFVIYCVSCVWCPFINTMCRCNLYVRNSRTHKLHCARTDSFCYKCILKRKVLVCNLGCICLCD